MHKSDFFTGWALTAYPDRGIEYFREHVKKHIQSGANFLWIGHNNPGEAIEGKDEPALSYAVYEAYINPHDKRHACAVGIVQSQINLLEACKENNLPVVFPVGYQIQMGETWNLNNPNELRRDYNQVPLDIGHISACVYSEQYKKDIQIFYKWIKESWVDKYKDIIILVNLADEPFGGDYSPCAEKEFAKRTGLKFKLAAEGTIEQQQMLGQFQSDYIVDYASWSAEAWHKICPEIPSTMSFCGHHGREENTMPTVPELFRNTPEYFHPTFDVYPRDGTWANPVSEEDMTMLIVFLKQIAYLSNIYNKPYWLWTTGNSWGLSQAAPDKSNISDCLANQFYAFSTAMENKGKLKGVGVWNYNIRNQGLFDDPHPIIYNPEQLFRKVTGFLKVLREELEMQGSKNYFKQPEAAIHLCKDYSNRSIGSSKQVFWIKCFNFPVFEVFAKHSINLVIDNSVESMVKFFNKEKTEMPKFSIFLCDGKSETSEVKYEYVNKLINSSKKTMINENIRKKIKPDDLTAEISTYKDTPFTITGEFINTVFSKNGSTNLDYYRLSLGDLVLLYNLTQKTININLDEFPDDYVLYTVYQSGSLKQKDTIKSLRKSIKMPILHHHEIAFAAKKGNELIEKLLQYLD